MDDVALRTRIAALPDIPQDFGAACRAALLPELAAANRALDHAYEAYQAASERRDEWDDYYYDA